MKKKYLCIYIVFKSTILFFSCFLRLLKSCTDFRRKNAAKSLLLQQKTYRFADPVINYTKLKRFNRMIRVIIIVFSNILTQHHYFYRLISCNVHFLRQRTSIKQNMEIQEFNFTFKMEFIKTLHKNQDWIVIILQNVKIQSLLFIQFISA